MFFISATVKKKFRSAVDVAYSAPSDRARPRWKKVGRRWTRSAPFDMPGPMFDLGVILLCLLTGLATLIV